MSGYMWYVNNTSIVITQKKKKRIEQLEIRFESSLKPASKENKFQSS